MAAIRESYQELGLVLNIDQLQRVGEAYQFRKEGRESIEHDRHEGTCSYFYKTKKVNLERVSLFVVRIKDEQKARIEQNAEETNNLEWKSLEKAREEAQSNPQGYASAFRSIHDQTWDEIGKKIREMMEEQS